MERSKSMKGILYILFASILFLGSCGGDGGGDGVASLTITGESGEQVNLNGTWQQACEDKTDGTPQSQIVSYTISGASFSATVDIYSGVADCAGSVDVTINQVGTTTLGEEVTVTLSASPVTATKGDILYSSVTFTPKTADAVTELNNKSVCGFIDWALDTTKEVLGESCMPALTKKDVFYIDDTGDPHLQYHGDEDEPMDGSGYPTVLNPTAAERL